MRWGWMITTSVPSVIPLQSKKYYICCLNNIIVQKNVRSQEDKQTYR